MFSFNSPYGACPKCDGLGTEMVVDEDLVVPDPELSLDEGAIDPWARAGRPMAAQLQKLLRQVAQECGVSHRVPFSKLPREARRIVLEGTTTEDEKRELSPFEGVLPNLERRFKETRSEYVRRRIQQYMNERICSACRGARLRPEALAVRVAGKTISEVVKFTIAEALAFFRDLALEGSQREVAERLLGEISNRLGFLANVGLSYLTLDRRSETLSGGEAQRIRLASQLGAGLVGVCYVLDEPTIGLHPRDNRMLLEALYRLRDMGNSLVVVEHDEETIRRADYLIDMGPGAGSSGGRLVAHGRPDEISLYPESITAKYLSGELEIPLPASRRKPANGWAIEVQGARQNNLKNVTVRFPLGLLCCVTGVSGSGKSTLVDDILYRAVHRKLNRSKDRPGEYDRILGIENIDRVAVIDQSPLGKTPRSNPCTYTGIFDEIRRLYSKVKESRVRGYTPARFSFNVKGGRCEACEGQGTKVIEMHFLPDVHVTCTQCRGTRYNQETLEVRYKGKNIAEVIKMSVEEAILFFQAFPRIVRMLTTLEDVGLGYISLGQPSTTLSGGEAQRVKLAAELGRGGDPSTSLRAAGHCLYIMDEPTTGLHFADIEKLLKVLGHLVDAGNSVILIEHNVHVIKCADYVIDLGPEGGDEGGGLVACGTPEEIAACADSHTGSVLASYLGRRAERSRSQALVSS